MFGIIVIEECSVGRECTLTARPWALEESRSVRVAILGIMGVARRVFLF